MWKRAMKYGGRLLLLAAMVWWGCATAHVMERKSTVQYKNSTVDITTYGEVEVMRVEPEVKIKKGEEKGNLIVTVELKNTGTKPGRFTIFASGVSQEGISEGGNVTVPKKGSLESGEKAQVKVKTNFKGKGLPSMIIVEVYSLEDLGHKPDVLETLFNE